jgi:hypothetical protein
VKERVYKNDEIVSKKGIHNNIREMMLWKIRNPSSQQKAVAKFNTEQRARSERYKEGKASPEEINTEKARLASRKSSNDRSNAARNRAIGLRNTPGAIESLQDDDWEGVLAILEGYDKDLNDQKRTRDEFTKKEFDAKTHRKLLLRSIENSLSQSMRMVLSM